MTLIPKKYHESWKEFFERTDIKDELVKIEKKIGSSYFPNTECIFRFTNCDLATRKCIIIGMEPYPSSFTYNGEIIPEATGRSFEVASILDKDWEYKMKQSSLRNILKTIYFNKTEKKESLEKIREEIKNEKFIIKKPKEWFDSLENQGVIFLNATLTVIPNKVDTHTKIWEKFMTELVYFMQEKRNLTWLLWGNKAQDRIVPLLNSKQTVTNTCHPRLAQFVDENCFKAVDSINWLG